MTGCANGKREDLSVTLGKFGLFASTLTAVAFGASVAQAASKCPANNIIGTWDDQYGSVATITSETKGTATASSIVCNQTGTVYNLVIKLSSNAQVAKATGKPPKGSSCPVVKATLKYAKGDCNTASGPVQFNGISINDTWTKQAAIKQQPRQSQSLSGSLGNGLR